MSTIAIYGRLKTPQKRPKRNFGRLLTPSMNKQGNYQPVSTEIWNAIATIESDVLDLVRQMDLEDSFRDLVWDRYIGVYNWLIDSYAELRARDVRALEGGIRFF